MTASRSLCRAIWILFVVLSVSVLETAAQAPPAPAQSDDELERGEATLKNGQREAALYTIRAMEDDRKAVTLQAESLLKWNNSVNKSVHGNIFLWTKDGRPEVIVSIYQFYSPKVDFCAEFQSLSLTPLVVTKEGEEVWTPQKPGVEFTAFEGVPAPASTKALRLNKMRQLAGEFDVEFSDYSRETYRLRLMPKPLWRYASTDGQVLDGAVFSYTYTTDPELLVLVEARQSTEGYRWMYGLARLNVGEIKVSRGDREIWKAERLEHPYVYKDGVYTLFQGLPLPKPVDAGK